MLAPRAVSVDGVGMVGPFVQPDALSAVLQSGVAVDIDPDSGVRSAIRQTDSFEDVSGNSCGTYVQTIDVADKELHAAAVVCKEPDGPWHVTVPTQLSMPKQSPIARR